MKKWLSAALLLFVAVTSFGQIEFGKDKVKVDFSIDRDGDEAYVIAKVKVVDEWHINAIKLPNDVFGFPSSFTLTENENFKVVGSPIEPKPHEYYDEAAKEKQVYHEGRFKIKQKIKILTDKDFSIPVKFEFQTCNAVMCLPPDNYKATVKVIADKQTNADSPEDTATNVAVVVDTMNNTNDTAEVAATTVSEDNSNENNDSNKETKESEDSEEEEESLWGIFLLSMGAGFLALLTPCVFPMIPMTVSFFTKQSKSKAVGKRNAIIYGISIIAIYIILGVVVTSIFGGAALNNMAASPTFNLIFFIILVVFAISFMGAFEIRLPSKWVNKADQRADKGGILGIFFMALALALVSFSCTGPIVGGLIMKAAGEGGMAPIIGMFGFSLALALPFTLFALFPSLMNSLPKSGGWLNVVKVVLGLLELAFALKFLSNWDFALQLHFLEREVFIALWIAIFGVLALYLFGKIRLPHDSPIEKLKVGRTIFATIVLAFTIYMIPGLWGAPLKLISAFPPPMNYSEAPLGFGGGGGGHVSSGEHVEGTHLGPQKIMVFHDYDLARAHAEKVNKPLFVDYTGYTCVNCRKMEETVWGEDGIIETLRNDVVIVSLHTDDQVDLPKEEQKTIDIGNGRTMELTTYGDKWKAQQILNHNVLAQPYYVMEYPKGGFIANGEATYKDHSDPKDFKAWLDKGMKLASEKK